MANIDTKTKKVDQTINAFNDEKNIMTFTQSFNLQNGQPIDAKSIFNSLSEATAYAKTAMAYSGKIIAVVEPISEKDQTKKATAYIIQEDGTLSPVGDKATIDNLDSAIKTLQTKDTEHDSAIKALQTKDTEHDNKFATIQPILEGKADNSVVNNIDGRLKTAEASVKTHGTDIAGLKSEDTAIKGRLDTAEEKITTLETADFGTQISNLDAAYKAADKKHTEDIAANAEAIKGKEAAGTAQGLINGLNKTDIAGMGAGKTIATLTESNGIINATFQDIDIKSNQVSDLDTTIKSYNYITSAGVPTISVATKAETNNENTVYAVTNITATGNKNSSITPTYTALPTKAYVDNEIKTKVAAAVKYLGTVSSQEELDKKKSDVDSAGDFCRVSKSFDIYHAGDLLLADNNQAPINWEVVHGELDKNTWTANSKTADGYVTKGDGQVNKVWKTDDSGNPGWRDDDNDNTSHSHAAGDGLFISGDAGTSGGTVTYTLKPSTDTEIGGGCAKISQGRPPENAYDVHLNVVDKKYFTYVPNAAISQPGVGKVGATYTSTAPVTLEPALAAPNHNYQVQLSDKNVFFVQVPWRDTWKLNTKDSEGYVAKGAGHANQVWKTDASGIPGWRNDDNDNTSHSHAAGVGLEVSGNAGTSGGTLTYTLKPSTTTEIGGGRAIAINQSAAYLNLSTPYSETTQNYAVQITNDGMYYVHVPWTSTNSNYVTKDTNQTITGQKTFSKSIVLTNTLAHSLEVNPDTLKLTQAGTVKTLNLPFADGTVATQEWVANKNYLTSHQSLANYVTLHTDQEITGLKTFKNGKINLWQDASTTPTIHVGNGGPISADFTFNGEGGRVATEEWVNANDTKYDLTLGKTHTQSVSGFTGTNAQIGPDGTTTYFGVTKINIGTKKKNVKAILGKIQLGKYDPITGDISVTFYSSAPKQLVKGTISYEDNDWHIHLRNQSVTGDVDTIILPYDDILRFRKDPKDNNYTQLIHGADDELITTIVWDCGGATGV